MRSKQITLLITLLFTLSNLHAQNIEDQQQQTIDYSQLTYWASHPEKVDSADFVPRFSNLTTNQENAEVDVFFVHPTTFFKKKNKSWNADINDASLNKKTDKTTIKHQASIFNGSCRIFAPRYRQAHMRTFYALKKNIKDQQALTALDFAYQDIKAAFEYYLANHNNDRPVILASHSQGTTHTKRLLQDFFDGKPLKEKLVTAYVVGMPVMEEEYQDLKPCENADETHCYSSWSTFGWGADGEEYHKGAVSTNPINWRTDGTYASKDESKGLVMRAFEKVEEKMVDAVSKDGIIWTHRPEIKKDWKLKLYFMKKNFHIADFNLFYLDVRHNVANRIKNYFNNLGLGKKHSLNENTSGNTQKASIE